MVRILDRIAIAALIAAATVVVWRMWGPEPARPDVVITQYGKVVPIGGGR